MSKISKPALDLVVAEEVTDRATYEKKYRHPTWPGGQSGVTIGIGYDIGAGVSSKEQLWADWKNYLAPEAIYDLEHCLGVTGTRAKSFIPHLEHISVPWDAAMAVLEKVTIPRYYAKTAAALPNFELLPLDCKGALVSLVYNRGASFALSGDRYTEMRAIKSHMRSHAFDKIPAELRKMKRIWQGQGLDGLLARRDREAALFELGLRAPQPPPAPAPAPAADDLLAARIVRAMRAKGYRVDTGADEMNIVYVDRMNADGSFNDGAPNKFNDRRFLIAFRDGHPAVVGSWEATIDPGRHWTQRPMNPKGAARIKFGQYRAWRVGIHNGDHEALVQRAPVTVHRDANKDYKREGDALDTGLFGINQHWGYDLPINDLGSSSAGCLVGRTKAGHRQFMKLVKSDPRFVADPDFMFTTAILAVEDFGTVAPPASESEQEPRQESDHESEPPPPPPSAPPKRNPAGWFAGLFAALAAVWAWLEAHPILVMLFVGVAVVAGLYVYDRYFKKENQ